MRLKTDFTQGRMGKKFSVYYLKNYVLLFYKMGNNFIDNRESAHLRVPNIWKIIAINALAYD